MKCKPRILPHMLRSAIASLYSKLHTQIKNVLTQTIWPICQFAPFSNCQLNQKISRKKKSAHMEIIVNTKSVSYAELLPKPSSPALVFPSRANVLFHNFNCLPRKLQCSSEQLRNLGAIYASGADSSPTNVVEKWILEPIGDGDTKHIGVKTAMPNAFEITSSVITIGRIADKVDVAIPVPTVSGVHARIQKTEESLLVTDLDSTNGTFIDERRLRPGVPVVAPPGSKITFGDTHLAIFRVSKLEVEEPINEPEAEAKIDEGADSN